MSGYPPAGGLLERTPSNTRATTFGVHCFERRFEGEESRPPVSLVVFDCDETLTLSTFMPKEREFESSIGWSYWPDYISMMNFGSPFLEGGLGFGEPFASGSRLARLQDLLGRLARGEGGRQRALAVLTRNARGAIACLNLLMMARLADHFTVIWSMAAQPGMPNAAYREGSTWKTFHAPFGTVYDHKADVLHSVARSPAEWIPQLAGEGGRAGPLGHLLELRPEAIVLVDDVRTNFQSPSADGPKVLRYCKVARYDGRHPQMGFLTDMGGIGAKRVDDYDTLLSFVAEPWKFKAEFRAVCMEQYFEGCEDTPPVSLVVFEFDETLSLYTFMPEDARGATEIGYVGSGAEEREHFVRYNFESPYVEGCRVAKLRSMLKDLSVSEEGEPRTLAILTENEAGAVAVLNLLLMADLADFFGAIWALSAEEGMPRGVFRDGADWKQFSPPAEGLSARKSKGDVLCSIVERPREWFPQTAAAGAPPNLAPGCLQLWNIVVIDDERTNFRVRSGDSPQALRYCKVARYDDIYRDQGLLMHMGGIGARTDKDYRTVLGFVDCPWKYRVAEDPELPNSRSASDADTEGLLEHVKVEEELRKLPRRWMGGRAQTAPAGDLSKLVDDKPGWDPPATARGSCSHLTGGL